MLTSMIVVLIAASACKKEEPTPTTPTSNTPNGIALNNFFNQNLQNLKQVFTLDASAGGTIIGLKGTKVNITANSLYTTTGQLVNGNVTIELVEIYDRVSMIFANKPTMGLLPSGEKAALISGGAYYLNISQNGIEIDLSYGILVMVPTSNPVPQMSIFNLVNDSTTNNLVWNSFSDSLSVSSDSIGTYYSIFYSSLYTNFNWINCDYFYSNPGPKTDLNVQLPTGFNSSNSKVFIAYDGEENLIGELYFYNNYFTTTNIPIGLNVHILVLTNINNQTNYSLSALSVSANQVVNVTSFTPTTDQNLADIINNLP